MKLRCASAKGGYLVLLQGLDLDEALYRSHLALMILVLRHQLADSTPAIGREPSNFSPEEMQREWEGR